MELFYPRSGWRRAAHYVAHRIKRLPDTPHKIALGFACGGFVTFSPMFGFHFMLAAMFAWTFRGNILASLLGTFVGNPITFPFIATTSYQLGLLILGYDHEETVWHKIQSSFADAFGTLWINFKALFGYPPVPWDGFSEFFFDVFLPYIVGGIIPGIICGLVIYFVSRPIIAAYQKRRKGRLVAKFKSLRVKRTSGDDGSSK